MPFSLSDCPSLSDYIARYQVDGVLWKAERLLKDIDNAIVRNERVADIARTIALMPAAHQVVKDDYILKISKAYNITRKTLEKLVDDQTEIEDKKRDIVRGVRKNRIVKLDGSPKTFPFFVELVNVKTKELKGIRIDTLKFVQLLGSFGFTRYASEGDSKDGYTFVRLVENVITEVSKEEIIDFIELFIQKEYDFDGAGCRHVDSDLLINCFYDNIKKYFSKDLFARVRNGAPIIISRDTATECFLYFKNGFVRITKDGYAQLPYDKLDGSVWAKQMLDRNFTKTHLPMAAKEDGELDFENSFTTDRPLGVFADFVWRVSAEKRQRFVSLCTIIGYLVHDFYNYKLRAILFTDSSVTDKSEGRTGKTLLGKMLALIRSMKEVNGKDFDAGNKNKYEDVERSTQIVHLNDVAHFGRFKFYFENIFNDVTEGFMVNAKFVRPFRHVSKFVISSNRTLPIEGESQRDRIVEFEMSTFFNAGRSPQGYYGQWFGQDWDQAEYNRFDNFICFCAQCFLNYGIIPPDTINLEARKLLDGTCREFLEFMGDMEDSIRTTGLPWDGYKDESGTDADFFSKKEVLADWRLDKKKLYDRFQLLYPDFKAQHFTNRRFHNFLLKYSALKLGIKEPTETRSHGNSYIQFKQLQPPQQ